MSKMEVVRRIPRPFRPLWLLTVALTASVMIVTDATIASGQSEEDRRPSAPAELRLTAEGPGSIEVTWTVPDEGQPPPTGYRVRFRRLASEPESPPVETRWWSHRPGADVGPDQRRALVDGLENDVWYEVAVAAVHDGGEKFSDERLLARPGSSPPVIRLPGGLDVRVMAQGNGSVTVAWEPPADDGGSKVTGYEVWYEQQTRDDPSNPGWNLAGTPDLDTRQYTVTGLNNYYRYQVGVAAVNAAGRGIFEHDTISVNEDDLGQLELLAGHRFSRSYTLGTDTWEVWICHVADGGLHIDLRETVDLLQQEIPPYFSWLSGGRYRPEFVAGGVVRAAARGVSDDSGAYECDENVKSASEGGSDGALIVLDKSGIASRGGPGAYATEGGDGPWRIVTRPYPQNRREILLTAGSVLPISAYCNNCRYPDHINLDIVAHEIGHALDWPHSFSGLRTLPSYDNLINEYDNPMDIVSGGPGAWDLGMHGLTAGTVAANRYAAGWIDPEDVAIHQEPYGSYWLSPTGQSGTRMLVLPTGEPGHFISLGARVAEGYDAGIPAEGVEVYRIDQRSTHCVVEPQPEDLDRLLCTGINRRTRPVSPSPGGDDRADHVYGRGDGLTVDGYRVEVTGHDVGRYRVWVGNPHEGTFADDEGNAHEANIETLADLGIAIGCNPELKLYCPDDPLTRAQMARFLIAALDETVTYSTEPSRFSDVPVDAWYRPYVERLAALEITAGFPDGTFRPDAPVTRGQMAVFLTRAFTGLTAVDDPTGIFADVPPTASYAGAVEGILPAGITDGCSRTPTLQYCPDRFIRRDHMATFLARALQIQG